MANQPAIAVIGGTGSLGSGLARLWAMAGYHVVIGSRSKEKAEAMAQTLGSHGLAYGATTIAARRARATSSCSSVPFSNHDAIVEEIKDGRRREDRRRRRRAAGAAEGVGRAAAGGRIAGAGGAANLRAGVRVVSAFHNVGRDKAPGRREGGLRRARVRRRSGGARTGGRAGGPGRDAGNRSRRARELDCRRSAHVGAHCHQPPLQGYRARAFASPACRRKERERTWPRAASVCSALEPRSRLRS